MILSSQRVQAFQQGVWDYYRAHPRSMPWRLNPSPYWVIISEVMLQQTQVDRVTPKFTAFVRRFPTIGELATAPLGEVLRFWSGLGYNRRAKALHQATEIIVTKHHGQLPTTVEELRALPGIGPYTAGAILAYAFNTPVVFIETNIRNVYFHHFFDGRDNVSDGELYPLVEQTLEHEHPREWYWALMDYGTHLKRTNGNNIKRSRHYKKQSAFEGSRRQLRGRMLKRLLEGPKTVDELLPLLNHDPRFEEVVAQLLREGLIAREDDRLMVRGAS